MNKILLFISLMSLLNLNSSAESEEKSKAQLILEGDVCFSGLIDSVSVYKKIDEFSAIYSAEITKLDFSKGLISERKSKKIKVFYRNAIKEGIFEEHSPHLIKGQKVKVIAIFKKGIYENGFSLWIPSKRNISLVTE